jgi:hypothetical protein
LQQVIAQIVPWKEPKHGTPEEAVAYAKARALEHKHANEAPFLHAPIDRIAFSDDMLEIGTRRGGIAVRIVGDSPVYTLVGEARDPTGTPSRDAAVEVSLGELRFVWDRAEIVGQMLGTSLVRVDGSPDRLWLYFSGIGVIAVSVLINQETGRRFLFWDQSE